jgi:hypothetical protein
LLPLGVGGWCLVRLVVWLVVGWLMGCKVLGANEGNALTKSTKDKQQQTLE